MQKRFREERVRDLQRPHRLRVVGSELNPDWGLSFPCLPRAEGEACAMVCSMDAFPHPETWIVFLVLLRRICLYFTSQKNNREKCELYLQ